LNALRDRRRKRAVSLESPDPSASGSWQANQIATTRDLPPTQNLQQVELAAVVRRALDQLNDRQRMAVVLNKFEDLNYAEIAEVMGLSPKAVKSLLSRARSRLRECLQAYVYMDSETPPEPQLEDGDE
jgi:RNA polymerase sigma-70 factor (ECF subfamily)